MNGFLKPEVSLRACLLTAAAGVTWGARTPTWRQQLGRSGAFTANSCSVVLRSPNRYRFGKSSPGAGRSAVTLLPLAACGAQAELNPCLGSSSACGGEREPGHSRCRAVPPVPILASTLSESRLLLGLRSPDEGDGQRESGTTGSFEKQREESEGKLDKLVAH